MSLEILLKDVRILPVLTIAKLEEAVPLAKALVAGGVRHLEITLRTPVALEAAKQIIADVPEAIVGLGTLTSPQDIDKAQAIGAKFILSPGATPALLHAAAQSGLPYIPGVQTASEVMQALDHGFTHMKFFPALQAGGVETLKALSGPFPQVRFCPTGGISAENAHDFLKLPHVFAVGGSWLAPNMLIKAKNFTQITQNARLFLENANHFLKD